MWTEQAESTSLDPGALHIMLQSFGASGQWRVLYTENSCVPV